MTKWQYGIVIDAGSSGSRVHVYRWLHPDKALKHADEKQLASLPEVKSKKDWTKKIKPGISTFGEKPDRVGPDHLQELLDHALDIIPADSVPETPIFLLATAGMRLLPDDQCEAILDETCMYIRTKTELSLPSCTQHIQVISGETEGLYGWISANYLLGAFDAHAAHDHGKGHQTYGFLDMGGASAQIAFAPNTTEAAAHANDLKLVRFRDVRGAVSEYRVFVTTWLEFGANEARHRFVKALLGKHGEERGELTDPCLPSGLRISTEGDILVPDAIDGREVQLVGTGRFDECLRRTYPLLNKNKPCLDVPCLLDGKHVPAIDFDVNHFVGVSEYWHTTHEIFEMAHRDKAYDFATYQRRVREFCSQAWPDVEEGLKKERWGKKVTASTAAEVCFKASWIINILHEGIGIPRVGLEGVPSSGSSGSDSSDHGRNGTKAVLDGAADRGFTDVFQAVNKIDGTEVSWTLGRAVLYAAAAVPPLRNNTLPVGFGANLAGGAVPPDFEFAGPYHPPRPNATRPGFVDGGGGLDDDDEGDSWKDTLFHGRTPRRVPGFVLFLLIVLLAALLLCGRERRKRLLRRVLPRFLGGGGRSSGSGRRGRGLFAGKPSMAHAAHRRHGHSLAAEGLLETGMHDPDDFELGAMDDLDAAFDRPYHDEDSVAGARTSGAATPALRAPHLAVSDADAPDSRGAGGAGSSGGGSGLSASSSVGSGLVGLGLLGRGSAMDRSGLVPRTDSRERLVGVGGPSAAMWPEERRSRSWRGSPTRFKSPLMASLAED